MSMKISPPDLAITAEGYGDTAYILATGDDGRPRVTHSVVSVDDDGVISASLGRGSTEIVRVRPTVSVLWPSSRDQSMSLIADGVVEIDADAPSDPTPVRIVVSGAVLHRPAPRGEI